MFTLEVPAKPLAQCLRTVSSIIQRSTIPVLSHAHIRVSGGSALISATDLDRWMTTELPCEGDGEITVGAEHLGSIASTLDPSSLMKMKANGSGIAVVDQGRAHFEMPTLPVEDFPSAPDRPVVHTWTLDSCDVAAAIKALDQAIYRDKSRDYLKGLFFDLPNGRLVATDYHRLGYETIGGLKTPKLDGFTLPLISVSVLAHLCKAAGELSVVLYEDASSVEFKCGKTAFRTKLMGPEQRFPEYDRVIPRGAQLTGSAHCAEFLRTITCASNVSDNHSGGVRSLVEFSAKEITIESKDGLGRRSVDVCDWERLSGKAVKTGFNCSYLHWAAASLGESKEIVFEIDSSKTALLMRAKDDVDLQSVRVVMPMDLND